MAQSPHLQHNAENRFYCTDFLAFITFNDASDRYVYRGHGSQPGSSHAHGRSTAPFSLPAAAALLDAVLTAPDTCAARTAQPPAPLGLLLTTANAGPEPPTPIHLARDRDTGLVEIPDAAIQHRDRVTIGPVAIAPLGDDVPRRRPSSVYLALSAGAAPKRQQGSGERAIIAARFLLV